MKSKTRKMKSQEGEVTMHALNQWYKSAFERLGWMVLAKSKGLDYKIKAYKIEISRLHRHICQKIDKVYDSDKKDDLVIMKQNVEVLVTHIHKDFK